MSFGDSLYVCVVCVHTNQSVAKSASFAKLFVLHNDSMCLEMCQKWDKFKDPSISTAVIINQQSTVFDFRLALIKILCILHETLSKTNLFFLTLKLGHH